MEIPETKKKYQKSEAEMFYDFYKDGYYRLKKQRIVFIALGCIIGCAVALILVSAQP